MGEEFPISEQDFDDLHKRMEKIAHGLDAPDSGSPAFASLMIYNLFFLAWIRDRGFGDAAWCDAKLRGFFRRLSEDPAMPANFVRTLAREFGIEQ